MLLFAVCVDEYNDFKVYEDGEAGDRWCTETKQGTTVEGVCRVAEEWTDGVCKFSSL